MTPQNNENPYLDQIQQLENPNNDKRKKLLNEFREYIQEDFWLDFNIIDWKLKVDNIWWFSDWEYKLDNYSIRKIDEENNIYIMEIDFKLKKWALTYKKTINLSFFYNNWNEIIIKYESKFYKVHISSKTSYIEHRRKHTIQTDIVWKKLPIKIHDLELLLEFKTD